MVSYPVLGAVAMIAFALGIIVGRRDERRVRVATGEKVIDVPPRSRLSADDAVKDPELHEHLEHGRMISAIKRYRDLTGVGLREAKQAVESLRWQP